MSSNKTLIINDYKKYWITDTKKGHLITICHGPEDKVLKLKLNWKNRHRSNAGRVLNKR
jgi:hypothetical protein